MKKNREKNRKLHGLLGFCLHEYVLKNRDCLSCGVEKGRRPPIPDYAAFQIYILREMRLREDWHDYIAWLTEKINLSNDDGSNTINLTIRWLEKAEKEKEREEVRDEGGENEKNR